MLLEMDGFAVCSKIRAKSNTPILIVSARDDKEDKLNGLLLGADDYIEKPYDIDILIAKVHGIFKRRYSTHEIMDGNIRLNEVEHKVWVNVQEITMTNNEFDLLLHFLENKGKVVKKEELFNKIWGFDSESELQTLTVHMKRLREKIEKNPKAPERILTIWGIGYRFE